LSCVVFKIPTAIHNQITVLWDVTPCSMVGRYQRVEVTCYFHFQGRRLRQWVISNVGIYLLNYTASQGIGHDVT
jgi:hypothetical protein